MTASNKTEKAPETEKGTTYPETGEKLLTGLPLESNLSAPIQVITTSSQPDLGQVSIDLYSQVSDDNGNPIGVIRVIATQRAIDAGDALEALTRQMPRFTSLGFTPISPVNPKPLAAQPAGSPIPAGTSAPSGTGLPPIPGATQSGSSSGSTEESGTWAVARMVVTPLPDANAKVEFYRQGQEKPCLKFNKIKTDRLTKMMVDGTGRAWEVSHFSVANQFNLNLSIDWKLGKETGYGGRYRDIVAIHAA